MTLSDIKKLDYRFLYELLKNRDPIDNISHQKMPRYIQHVKFVSSKPYTIWKIIYHKTKKVGSIYLTEGNEIGLHLKKEFQWKNIEKESLKILMHENPRMTFYANISPKNVKLIEFYRKKGFKLVQKSYELKLKERNL